MESPSEAPSPASRSSAYRPNSIADDEARYLIVIASALGHKPVKCRFAAGVGPIAPLRNQTFETMIAGGAGQVRFYRADLEWADEDAVGTATQALMRRGRLE